MPPRKKTAVIGAGVIGLAAAWALRKRGRDVVVFDQGGIGSGSSAGNAGWIVPSLSGPVPSPGLIWKSIKWMLQPASPLYVRPSAVPGMSRWLWHFWKHCNAADYDRGLAAVAALNARTLPLYDQLAAEGVSFEYHKRGLLCVFRSPAYMEAVRGELEAMQPYGYRIPEPLGSSALVALEPQLRDDLACGLLIGEDTHVRPESLTAGYAAALVAEGVTIHAGRAITGFKRGHGRVEAVLTADGGEAVDEVLIAAGAWSASVAGLAGVRLPVQAAKGYSITVPSGDVALTRPLYMAEAKIACSPFDGHVRFAGTMELSGVNTVLDRRRLVGIRRGVGQYLRVAPSPDAGVEWVGMRPLTPDGLPLLGPLPGLSNAFVATGHGTLGVTMAPVTGEVMADLMVGESSPQALSPFQVDRFSW